MWIQLRGGEPMLLARPEEFAMIPGGGMGPVCKVGPDDGWNRLEPLDLVGDYQHTLPRKERLVEYGGPPVKKEVTKGGEELDRVEEKTIL